MHSLSLKPSNILLFLGIILFSIYFIFVSFSRHDNFYSRRLDLGNMDQTVWNVLHGNGFTLTDPMGTQQESRLAVHADYLLVLLAPLYLIWSNPKMLLLVQAIILAFGAIPIYWYAKEKLHSKNIALLFSFMYLLYPALERMTLHDFHAVALSTTFLLFAFWYMYKKQYLLFVLFSILAGIGKEQVWATIGLMGIYIFFVQKKRIQGLVVAVTSFVVFYLLFWIFIPKVSPTQQHWALIYLSEFGGNQNQIIENILRQPTHVFADLFASDRLFYYLQLFFPVGFLSLFSPFTLIYALPTLLINALSNNSLMRQIDYQYTSTITPWIFIGAVNGFLSLKKYTTLKKLLSFQVVCMIIASFLWGELPFGRQSRMVQFTKPQLETKTMLTVEKNIPNTYSVSATNNIGAHFSQRKYLYNFPVNATLADYVVVELGDPYAWPSGDDQKNTLNSLLTNPAYELIANTGTFYALKRKELP